MRVRASLPSDLEAIKACHRDAFGVREGPEIAELVDTLLRDEAEGACLSLVAESEVGLVGHILFTPVQLQTAGPVPRARILAPLGVARAHQRRGIGGLLTREGLERLTESDVELVFVLGHPGYYPKFGFQPAGALGLDTPHPIPPESSDAWMVLALPPGDVGRFQGRVVCSSVLNDPKYWRE